MKQHKDEYLDTYDTYYPDTQHTQQEITEPLLDDSLFVKTYTFCYYAYAKAVNEVDENV